MLSRLLCTDLNPFISRVPAAEASSSDGSEPHAAAPHLVQSHPAHAHLRRLLSFRTVPAHLPQLPDDHAGERHNPWNDLHHQTVSLFASHSTAAATSRPPPLSLPLKEDLRPTPACPKRTRTRTSSLLRPAPSRSLRELPRKEAATC